MQGEHSLSPARTSIACEFGAVNRPPLGYGIRQDAPDGRQRRSRKGALAGHSEFRNFPGEFPSAIEPQAKFPEKVAGHIGIVGSLHAPEAKAYFILLKELQRVRQLLHSDGERRGKEIGGY